MHLGLTQRSKIVGLLTILIGGVGACAADATTEQDDPSFVSACTPENQLQALTAVTPDVPVDYLSIQYERRDASKWKVTTQAERGSLCAGATDVAACKDKVAKLRVLTPVCDFGDADEGTGCFVWYLLYTRGDDVLIAETREEINSLIGRVDNLTEAVTLANARGYTFDCHPSEVPARFKEIAGSGGYELMAQNTTCTDAAEVQRFAVRLRVDADGMVMELSRREHSRTTEPGLCVPLPTR